MSPLLNDFLYHTKAGLKGLYMLLRPADLTPWAGEITEVPSQRYGVGFGAACCGEGCGGNG